MMHDVLTCPIHQKILTCHTKNSLSKIECLQMEHARVFVLEALLVQLPFAVSRSPPINNTL